MSDDDARQAAAIIRAALLESRLGGLIPAQIDARAMHIADRLIAAGWVLDEPPLLDDPDILERRPTYASVKRDLDGIRNDLAAIIKRDRRL